MRTVAEIESTGLLRSATHRASAEALLLKTERPASLFLVCVNVVCTAGTFAFVAARPEPMFLAITGGIAGAALALGALSLGETRRLRSRLEAVLVLSRDNVA